MELNELFPTDDSIINLPARLRMEHCYTMSHKH